MKQQIIELLKNDSWRNVPIEITVDKIFTMLGICNSLDLKKLDRKFDEILNNDTRDSLSEWLNKNRQEQTKIYNK